MRKGFNPNKEKGIEKSNYIHQIVIPVYIPNNEGYFKDSLKILHICLESLIKTIHRKTFITIVNNGSNKDTIEYLNSLFKLDKIQEVIHTENIGKINAVSKGIKGHNFDFITVSDADVLFINGWEEQVFKIFKEFPKSGAVCPTPVFRKHNNFTANIWYDYFFSDCLRFTEVVNPEAMTRFANSIGWPWLDHKYKDVMLTLKSNSGLKAMVGCSHFVATYRKEVFKNLPKSNSIFQLGGDSETEYLDKVVIKSDFYRLSTEDNYAYHLGNKLESWHIDEYNKIKKDNKSIIFPNSKFKGNSYGYFLKSKLFKYLVSSRLILRWFYKLKGLNRNQIIEFIGK